MHGAKSRTSINVEPIWYPISSKRSKAYATQEEEVLLQVVEARNKVSQMNVSPETLSDPAAFEMFQQNQGALSSALSRLLGCGRAVSGSEIQRKLPGPAIPA